MKMSEAIRLGSLLRPQAYGEYASADGRTCAIGASLEAVGVRPRFGEGHDGEAEMYTELLQTPDWLEWKTVLSGKNPPCPACGDDEFRGYWDEKLGPNPKRNISSTIIHLNNDHRWTREQIADWVATFETSDTPAEQSVREAVPA